METTRVMAIGAHPDDCEFRCGGMGIRWARQGHRVCFLSVTNGQAGHQLLSPAALAQRRAAEAAAAGALAGIESRILPIPDGHLEPSLHYRLMLIRAIREFAPDLILTNRPNDYHPDHRSTAQLVQDAAFLLTVPQVAPEAPALRRSPIILYWFDAFQKPSPFAADVAVSVDDVLEAKIQMLHQHASQVYEWLPWLDGILEQVPRDEEGRKRFLRKWFDQHSCTIAQACRAQLVARYGAEKGIAVQHAEAFEACEYGSAFDASQRARFFGES